jgi:uncharacterized protein (TIGR03435 family)
MGTNSRREDFAMHRNLLFLTLAIYLPSFAQTPKPAFDAASIKPSKSEGFAIRTMIGGGPGGRYSAQGVTARDLILQAYGMQEFQVTGGPGWITSDRFDIEATPGPGITPTQEQTRQMLQSLLEERFQLKVRQETKPSAAYILSVAKNGPKLKEARASENQPGPGPAPVGGGAVFVGRGGPGGPGGGRGGMMRMAPGNVSGQAMPIEILIRMISNQVGRPIVDQTGLTGSYDIELQWTPDRLPPAGALPPGAQLPPVDPNGPSIFAALQEQLGLRLDATTQPGLALTIERIEKPSEN